jgi:hypothetical protein
MMLRFLPTWAALALMAGAVGCESSPEFLTSSELDSLNKLRSGQYALVSNQELSALKHDAETVKNMGRYQIHREGFRTWRLDTTTGEICLLLTSEGDWKKPETELQSCSLSQANN